MNIPGQSLFRRASAVLASGVIAAVTLMFPAPTVDAHPTSNHIVCLSSGHGGTDTGAVNGNLTERDLNWVIATKLQAKLSGAGYTVVFTHGSTDDNPSGTERAQRCNSYGADTVLWIHLNSSSNPAVDYFKAFWGKKNKDEAFCKTLTNNVALLRADGSGLALDKQPVGQFASSVMLKSTAPACLVENVFLSNTDEGNLFRSQPGVREQQIADQLYNGLVAWYANR